MTNLFQLSTIELAPGVIVPKIGIGTWGIGGYMKPNPYNDDDNDIKQMKYQLEQGLTMIDTWLAQAEGRQAKLVAEAIKDFSRDKYFIVSKLDVKNFIDKSDVEKTVDQYLVALGIDHIDMLQIHKPEYIGVSAKDCVEEINRMVDIGKAKLLGICNANTSLLQEVLGFTKHPFTSNEINFSVIDRTYKLNGTIDFCSKNNVKILAYKPLARGTVYCLTQDPLFKELSTKYNRTPGQIALNWLLSKPNFFAWVKSVNPSHINENLDCLSFIMDSTDHQKLDDWRYQL